MATAAPTIHIDRTPDDVWALVGVFADLSWMAGVDGTTIDGDVRTVSTMGMEIQEQLISHSDDDRVLSYAIVNAPFPLDAHQATISVAPDGDGSLVTWEVSVAPDDAIGLFEPIYAGSLGALKAHLEG